MSGASDGGSAVVVALRIRPLNRREIAAGAKGVITASDGQSLSVVDPTALLAVDALRASAEQRDGGNKSVAALSSSIWSRQFNFDHVFDSQTPHGDRYDDQDAVFDALGTRVLESAWEGYNCSLLAYGQTGAGKSYSMMGTGAVLDSNVAPQDYGLIPRIAFALFQSVHAAQANHRQQLSQNSTSGGSASSSAVQLTFAVEVSYMEIYNETVFDLFAASASRGQGAGGGGGASKGPNSGKLRVREHPNHGVYVEGLTVVAVSDYTEVGQLMALGGRARTVASTNMNDTSSRSHAIFTVAFKQGNVGGHPGSEKVSRLHMVDLAGSERVDQTGASGERLREAKNINKSLATLCDVVKALSAQDKAQYQRNAGRGNASAASMSHVPYRNSVLTWLLKESLGGNARTTMLAAVSPAANAYDETISTLKYAERAKRMRTRAVVNARVSDEHLIAALRGEVAALRAELNARRSSDAVSSYAVAASPGDGATRRAMGGGGFDSSLGGPHDNQGFDNGYSANRSKNSSSGGERTSGGQGLSGGGNGSSTGGGIQLGARSNSRVASKKQRKAARRRPNHHHLSGERAPPPGGGVLSPVNEEEEIDEDEEEEEEYATEEDLDNGEGEESGVVMVSELSSPHDFGRRRFSAPQRLQNQQQQQQRQQQLGEENLKDLPGMQSQHSASSLHGRSDESTSSSTVALEKRLFRLEQGLAASELRTEQRQHIHMMGTGATAADQLHRSSANTQQTLPSSHVNSSGNRRDFDEETNEGSFLDNARRWPAQANSGRPEGSNFGQGDENGEDNNHNGEFVQPPPVDRFSDGSTDRSNDFFSPRQFPPGAPLNSSPSSARHAGGFSPQDDHAAGQVSNQSHGNIDSLSTSSSNSSSSMTRRPEPVPSPPPVPRERPAWLAAYSEPSSFPPAPEALPQPPQQLPSQLQLPAHEEPSSTTTTVAAADRALRAVTTSPHFDDSDGPNDGGLTPTTLSPSSSVGNEGVGFGSNDGPLMGSRDWPDRLTPSVTIGQPLSSSTDCNGDSNQGKNSSSGSNTSAPLADPTTVDKPPSTSEAPPPSVGPAAAVLAAVALERSAALEAMGVVALVPDGGTDSAPSLDPSRPRLVNLNQDPLFSECLVYYLNAGVTLLGADPNGDVPLSGPDMKPRHAVLTYSTLPESATTTGAAAAGLVASGLVGGGLIHLCPVDGALTYVNGRLVSELPSPDANHEEAHPRSGSDERSGSQQRRVSSSSQSRTRPVLLAHGARIVFGRHHVFRFEQPLAADRGLPEDVAQRRADRRTARSISGKQQPTNGSLAGSGSSVGGSGSNGVSTGGDDDNSSVTGSISSGTGASSSTTSSTGAGNSTQNSSCNGLGVKFDWDFALRELLLHSPEAPIVNPDGLLLAPPSNSYARRSSSRSRNSLHGGSGSGGLDSDGGGSDDSSVRSSGSSSSSLSARRSYDRAYGRSGSRSRAGSARRSREFPFLAAGASAAAGGGSSSGMRHDNGLRGSRDSLSSLGKGSSHGHSSVNGSFEEDDDDMDSNAYYDEGYQRLLALETKVRELEAERASFLRKQDRKQSRKQSKRDRQKAHAQHQEPLQEQKEQLQDGNAHAISGRHPDQNAVLVANNNGVDSRRGQLLDEEAAEEDEDASRYDVQSLPQYEEGRAKRSPVNSMPPLSWGGAGPGINLRHSGSSNSDSGDGDSDISTSTSVSEDEAERYLPGDSDLRGNSYGIEQDDLDEHHEAHDVPLARSLTSLVSPNGAHDDSREGPPTPSTSPPSAFLPTSPPHVALESLSSDAADRAVAAAAADRLRMPPPPTQASRISAVPSSGILGVPVESIGGEEVGDTSLEESNHSGQWDVSETAPNNNNDNEEPLPETSFGSSSIIAKSGDDDDHVPANDAVIDSNAANAVTDNETETGGNAEPHRHQAQSSPPPPESLSALAQVAPSSPAEASTLYLSPRAGDLASPPGPADERITEASGRHYHHSAFDESSRIVVDSSNGHGGGATTLEALALPAPGAKSHQKDTEANLELALEQSFAEAHASLQASAARMPLSPVTHARGNRSKNGDADYDDDAVSSSAFSAFSSQNGGNDGLVSTTINAGSSSSSSSRNGPPLSPGGRPLVGALLTARTPPLFPPPPSPATASALAARAAYPENAGDALINSSSSGNNGIDNTSISSSRSSSMSNTSSSTSEWKDGSRASAAATAIQRLDAKAGEASALQDRVARLVALAATGSPDDDDDSNDEDDNGNEKAVVMVDHGQNGAAASSGKLPDPPQVKRTGPNAGGGGSGSSGGNVDGGSGKSLPWHHYVAHSQRRPSARTSADEMNRPSTSNNDSSSSSSRNSKSNSPVSNVAPGSSHKGDMAGAATTPVTSRISSGKISGAIEVVGSPVGPDAEEDSGSEVWDVSEGPGNTA